MGYITLYEQGLVLLQTGFVKFVAEAVISNGTGKQSPWSSGTFRIKEIRLWTDFQVQYGTSRRHLYNLVMKGDRRARSALSQP